MNAPAVEVGADLPLTGDETAANAPSFGGNRLTPREQEVLRLMAEGRSNGGIANQLVVMPKAVEKHIANIFSKLGLPADAAEHHRRVLAVLTYLRSQRDGQ